MTMTRDDLVMVDEHTAYLIFPSRSRPGKWRVFRVARVGNGWQATGGRPPETRLVCEDEAEARAAAERLAYEATMAHVKARSALIPYRVDEGDEAYYRRVALVD